MKPMLAAATDGVGLEYPVLVSPKLDGVRALVIDGVVVSRSMKPIPNRYVQRLFGKPKYNGLDGELVVGEATAKDAFRATTSGVMSIKGRPDVNYYVFDYHNMNRPFMERIACLETAAFWEKKIIVVPHTVVNNKVRLLREERTYLKRGFEGLMIRSPSGMYKYGRSTLKQGWLLKMKRFVDGEARIVDIKELRRNGNDAITNALGYKERSHKKAGMVGMGKLGSFVVEDIRSGVVFDLGSGFTEANRKEMWNKDLIGKIVKYKFQQVGVKEKPRFPVFIGFRSKFDM